ncbi:ornithine cyclodeaminase [Brachybacterium sp. AOP43-C2-M15]|uniref:ornithine cyclodeaminase n=1 Tax=Brachybacterium sp. AOP43-C2-M15 TaxID=3457661 RepID=UPI004034AE30
MPHLLDVPGMSRWIQRDGPESILSGLARVLEEDLLRWTSFEKIPRVASHTPYGVIELMPITDGHLYSFKYVNGHPLNPARGLQTVTAFGVLADVDNGYPIFFAEMTLLTALRTAAQSALAAREMARSGARVHALIGAGSQAEFQALAFRALLGIDRLRVMDLDGGAVEKVRRNLEPLGFEVVLCESVDEAVAGADVITTCTADKARTAVLHRDQVGPGVHVNAIGGDCPGKTELDPSLLEHARVVVEFAEQTRSEGEIQQLPPEFEVAELWQVLSGEAAGRTDDEEITVFDSVGFALADFSALRYAQQATRGAELLSWIDVIADPDDPKDLFSLVTAADR